MRLEALGRRPPGRARRPPGRAADQPGSLQEIAARPGRRLRLLRHGSPPWEDCGKTARHSTCRRPGLSTLDWPKHIDTKGFLGYRPVMVARELPLTTTSEPSRRAMIRSMTGYGRAEVAGARLSLSVECKSVNHRHLDVAAQAAPGPAAPSKPDARRLIQARGAARPGGRQRDASTAARRPRAESAHGQPGPGPRVRRRPPARSRDEPRARRRPVARLAARAAGRAHARGAGSRCRAEEAWPLLERALSAGARRARASGARPRARRSARSCARSRRGPGRPRGRDGRSARRWRSSAGPRGSASGCRRCSAGAASTRRGSPPRSRSGRSKTDITEELARLRAHLDRARARCSTRAARWGARSTSSSRRSNREVNTVGSKADDLEISQAVIAAKSTLEKLREQVQNLE